jgi:hypothetical protein
MPEAGLDGVDGIGRREEPLDVAFGKKERQAPNSS